MGNLAYQYELHEELLNGKVVAMSPRPAVNHNTVILNIATIFNNHLQDKPCIAFCDGVDVYLTEKDIVIPDVMIVCNKDIIKKNGVHGAPDLIVEVLSPSTVMNDRGYKKKLYEKCGVKEYWIIEEATRSIEVYILQEGVLELNSTYSIFPDYLIESMGEKEKIDMPLEFNTSVLPDLSISLKKVFNKLI